MTNEFTPISWQPHQVVEKADLDQLVGNQNYLFEHMPKMVWKNPTWRDTGIKLLAGVAPLIAPGPGQNKSTTVNYQGEFATGCSPIITTGLIVTNSNEHDSRVTIRGLGSTAPNETGFQARFSIRKENKNKQKVMGAVYVHYMAMGYYSNTTA